LSSIASAEIVDNGDYTTVNGIDWLDMSFTDGLSYNDVLSRIDTGGNLDTWSVGSFVDVASMYQALGYVHTPNSTATLWDENGVNDVFRLGVLPLLGSTYRQEVAMGKPNQRVYEFIVGNVSNADPFQSNMQQTVQTRHNNDISSYAGKSFWRGDTWGSTWDTANEYVGTYLMRTSLDAPALSNAVTPPVPSDETGVSAVNVSSPIALSFFGMALLGAAGLRRQRSTCQGR
jgi:hypothetical protein